MGKNFKGKNGTFINFITGEIGKEISKTNNSTNENRKRKVKPNSYKPGHLFTCDRKNIHIGFKILEDLTTEFLDRQSKQLSSGEKDVSRIKKEVIGYRNLIERFLGRISINARNQYELQRQMDLLADFSQISQAARDGIILKQDKRIETINGEKKEITYDTSMTPKEVLDILKDYQSQSDRLTFDRLNYYLGLGLGLAGTIGAISNENKTKDKGNKGILPLITLGTAAVSALKLFRNLSQNDTDIEIKHELIGREIRMTDDFLANEPMSTKDEKDRISNIEDLINKEGELTTKIDNKSFAFDAILDLVEALISGIYINSKIKITENGKIDGKFLVPVLQSLSNAKGTVQYFSAAIQNIIRTKEDRSTFKETCEKAKNILEQMENKVYPLKGAKHSFDSIELNDFIGKFYPKVDYETGKIHYCSTIKVPEFSMKRGDVVLLSGESGSGKSTFLRLLKRGDINNRKSIKLDNGEKVDNLGSEYISFRPSIELGDEFTVLSEITGKTNISDLTKDEKHNLLNVLKKLHFNSPNLLEELASRKFTEFSTGQQKRLALSKMFYRIEDGTSVIIVDEPVGNVEDSLIKEQLQMITDYAKSRNVMLLLTTHRLDLAEDFATKRYHINNEGILEQLPMPKKEKETNIGGR